MIFTFGLKKQIECDLHIFSICIILRLSSFASMKFLGFRKCLPLFRVVDTLLHQFSYHDLFHNMYILFSHVRIVFILLLPEFKFICFIECGEPTQAMKQSQEISIFLFIFAFQIFVYFFFFFAFSWIMHTSFDLLLYRVIEPQQVWTNHLYPPHFSLI